MLKRTLREGASWTVEDAADLYHLSGWSDGYFSIDSAGRVVADVDRDGKRQIVIDDVVAQLKADGLHTPVVIRFQDIIKSRVEQLNRAFNTAREDYEYAPAYRGVYPIKVNQLHEVVDEILEAGLPHGMGLECGSKAELVAAMPYLDADTFLICNGYKDAAMFDLILTGQQLQKTVIPVIEKWDEFERLLAAAAARGLRPEFGVRIRLSTSGSGKWADSGGDLSKFGVSIPELLRILARLDKDGLTDCLVLLHFHLGSQIAQIQTLRSGITEITRIYCLLRARGVGIKFLDVGGGLGVNYEADAANPDEGINYTLQEYANAVISLVQEVCTREGAEPPIILSESGRAITAHHSVLVVDVLSTYSKDTVAPGFSPADTDHPVVLALHQTLMWLRTDQPLRPGELLEAYHDAAAKRSEAESLFGFGYLPLEQKGLAEELYWSVCHEINRLVRESSAEWLPAELEALDQHLVDQYLCDFSVFQSILDHWAFGQRFPIMPLTRLTEEPERRAVLVDLTCDSDGKVSRYVSANDDKRFLDVHALRQNEPYRLGFFLMGAYQDIMGDMHNLFGRVAEVHVYADADEPGGFYIEKSIPGARVQEILALVQYFPEDLRKRMEKMMLKQVQNGGLRRVEAVRLMARYADFFGDTTYLNPDTAGARMGRPTP
ncbi:MAG: arginine decarboxylase [Rhodothermales bacterium]|jgi:arginine decarboxylase